MKTVDFKTSEAVASHCGAMEAETISKNGRSSKSQMSRGNFLLSFIALVTVIVLSLVSCGGGGGSGSGSGSSGSGGKSSGKIKMSTEADGRIILLLAGSGLATVDWGDGSEKVTLTLHEEDGLGVTFEHTYPNASLRTITVNGDNITGLYTEVRAFTSFDVSRCTELTSLMLYYCSLKTLDLSKNTALTKLLCSGLSTATLNAMFGTLHNKAGEKVIYMSRSSESEISDRSIAENKGWTVHWR